MTKIKPTVAETVNPDGRPLRLSPGFFARRAGRERLIVQPPTPEQRADLEKVAGRLRVPIDVLLPLEALRLLADQGNYVAKRLYVGECRKLGIWYDQKWFIP